VTANQKSMKNKHKQQAHGAISAMQREAEKFKTNRLRMRANAIT